VLGGYSCSLAENSGKQGQQFQPKYLNCKELYRDCPGWVASQPRYETCSELEGFLNVDSRLLQPRKR